MTSFDNVDPADPSPHEAAGLPRSHAQDWQHNEHGEVRQAPAQPVASNFVGTVKMGPRFDSAIPPQPDQSGAVDEARFTKDVPVEQGWYWHWNGDEDCRPIPTSVLWSGTTQSCFVSRGQLGLTEAVYCDKYGGYWLKMAEPWGAIDAAIATQGNWGAV